jgi:ABC-type branched-subunit amino acid transport system substrate-binding protein
MTLRLEQYRAESGKDIKIVPYDTQGKTLEAARIIKRLATEDVAAVVGPLTSEATSVASAVLSCGDMPLIVPAASQAGLTELSSTCFQLTANLDWQGVRMADLAIEYLGADTAAIMTPTSPENLSMARAFAERFKERGGTILAIEYFRVRETDYGPFVKDIKSLILGELLDSLIFIDQSGDTIEAEEVPVWIDCIYIPADPPQLRLLLPQIQFYNLKTALLGGDGWSHKSVYDLGENVLGMHYFTSGRIIDDDREQTRQFYFDFDQRFGHQPGRLEALGYDALSLYFEAFDHGNFSREAIVRYLSSVKDYQGVAGDVSFGSNRENIDLPVYRINRGRPEKVDFRLGKK